MGGIFMSETRFFIKGPMPYKAPTGRFWIGWDVGQAKDYSAIAILQKEGNRYVVSHLERLPLDMSYPQQVESVFQKWHKKPLNTAEKTLVMDYTGIGRAVLDLTQDRGLNPIGIAISGGNSVNWNEEHNRATVPKKDLIGNMQVLAQSDRLKVASGLRFGPVLAQELQSFKVKIDARTSHDSYGSWREGEHDDLILATAIALWYAEYRTTPQIGICRLISSGLSHRRW